MLVSQSLFPHSLFQLHYLSTHSMKFPLSPRKFLVTTAKNSCSSLIPLHPLSAIWAKVYRLEEARKEGEEGCNLFVILTRHMHISPLAPPVPFWETRVGSLALAKLGNTESS